MKRIIVLAGYAGSGKDTAAVPLYEQGFVRMPLAGPLKLMLKELLKLRGADESAAEAMVNGPISVKEEPTPLLNGKTPRHAMQTLGTEWGRNLISPTLWLDTWWDGFSQLDRDVVITDCRFANEAAYLAEKGAEIYLVKRPGIQQRMNHASEDLSWAWNCEVLWNDFPTAEEFQDTIRARFSYGR